MQNMYRNILIVEDDEDDKALFLSALQEIDNNINYEWASNGEEALNTLNARNENLPQCIFYGLQYAEDKWT